MSDNTTAVGLLNDLQKLDEAGRCRMLEFLPAGVLKDVLLASLRERDKTANSVSSQPLSAKRSLNSEPTYPTVVGYTVEADHSQDERRKKRKQTKTEKEERNSQAVAEKRDIGSCGLEPKEPPMYFYVSDGVLRDELPIDTQTELMRRFKKMWSTNEHTIAEYKFVTHSLEQASCVPACIYYMLDHGDDANGPTFTQGGKLEKSADDRCINAGYPCADVRWHDSRKKYVICVVPLPAALRKGKCSMDIGYWVL